MFKHSKAFTLLEILLVVAAIGILAAIVIVAINPNEQLGKVRDSERQSEVNTLYGAIQQYNIDNGGQWPDDITTNEYREICDTEAVSSSDCLSGYVDLSALVPKQLAAVPRGPQASESGPSTNYAVTQDESGNVAVLARGTEVQSSDIKAGSEMNVGYGLENASYTNQSKDIFSSSNRLTGVTFNTDGTKMFVVDEDNNKVESYVLSSAYDLSSNVSFKRSFDVSTQSSLPTEVTFNPAGTSMFVTDRNGGIYSYNLTNGYDLSNVTYNTNKDLTSNVDQPTDVTFNGDGSKMFIADRNSKAIHSYTLSSAYDLSSNVSFGHTFNLTGGTQINNTEAVGFSNDGTRMFASVDKSSSVKKYTLSTGWDLTTASYSGSVLTVGSEDRSPRGIAFNGDGTKLFMAGFVDKNAVFQYDTSTQK
ncbi:MAG: hypothetical protein BRC24_02220 [Parcubacteria group bacterium SW_4_46_8]|nr:MAG: hypothetical protein BRC24_02220 [Parcubacteria group bacterium SW_4_46_8]